MEHTNIVPAVLHHAGADRVDNVCSEGDICNAPMGRVRPDVGEGVQLLGKSTGAMASLRQQEFVSPKVDVQAWPLSNMTVQEDLL